MAEYRSGFCSALTECAPSGTGETYTIREVMALVGVSESTVYGFFRAKLFPYAFADGQFVIPKDGFDTWWEKLNT